MSETRRGRLLLVAVLSTSVALVAASRWAGRLLSSPAETALGPETAPPSAAAGVAGSPDLTFYKTLGGGPTAGKRPAAAPDAGLRAVPGDVVTPEGVFVVQVLATRDEAQAKRTRDRLASRGFPAAVIEDESGGVVVYRVRVGRWRERATAEQMADKIREQAGLEPWVLREAER